MKNEPCRNNNIIFSPFTLEKTLTLTLLRQSCVGLFPSEGKIDGFADAIPTLLYRRYDRSRKKLQSRYTYNKRGETWKRNEDG